MATDDAARRDSDSMVGVLSLLVLYTTNLPPVDLLFLRRVSEDGVGNPWPLPRELFKPLVITGPPTPCISLRIDDDHEVDQHPICLRHTACLHHHRSRVPAHRKATPAAHGIA